MDLLVFHQLSDEKVAQRRIAVNMLMEVIVFLESRKVEVGARHLVETESELRALLIPRKPGTTESVECFEGSRSSLRATR